ncbi:hypothetical protein HDV01_001456 [Terramyces sp. JEL0728]|nr:hypothetical protein HDV01_001456 [Terramyces sp. JEL0728]
MDFAKQLRKNYSIKLLQENLDNFKSDPHPLVLLELVNLLDKDNVELIKPYFMCDLLGLDVMATQLKYGNEFLPVMLKEFLSSNPIPDLLKQCSDYNNPNDISIKNKINTHKLFNLLCTIPEFFEFDLKPTFNQVYDGIKEYPVLCDFLNKLCARGFAKDIAAVFKHRVDSDKDVGNIQQIFQMVNQRTLEQLFFNFIILIDQDRRLQTSELISSYIQSLFLDMSIIKELLDMKAISNLQLSNCMVDALVITTTKINTAACLFTHLIDLWTSKAFVKSASYEYHVKVTVAILSCFRILKKIPVLKVSQAIPNYLEESREKIKMMGMNLGEVLLKDQEIKLEFGFEKPDFFRVLERPIEKKMTDYANPTDKAPERKPALKPQGESILAIRKLNESKKHLFKPEPDFVKSGELKLLIKKKEKTPKFLFDAIKLLKSSEAEEVLISIKSVEALIEKASEKEINDNSTKLTELLLHLENQFGTLEFEDARMKSLATLCIRNLENTTGNYERVFSEQAVGEGLLNCLTICVGLGKDQILIDELALVILSIKSGYEKERIQAIQICRNSQMWEILEKL